MKKEYFSPEIKVEEFLSTPLLGNTSLDGFGDTGYGDLYSKFTLGFEEEEDEE